MQGKPAVASLSGDGQALCFPIRLPLTSLLPKLVPSLSAPGPSVQSAFHLNPTHYAQLSGPLLLLPSIAVLRAAYPRSLHLPLCAVAVPRRWIARQMDVVLNAIRIMMGSPPFLSDTMIGQLAEPPHFTAKASFPDAVFTRARKDQTGRKLPQAIAHRGYNAKFPENTMSAFRGAVAAGVHALETDVHLTKDGEVVLSHDATLQRCFGVDRKLLDCDYKYIAEMRTIKAPHEHMPRLQDVVEYLAQPELSNIWLLLDIKVDNVPEDILRQMSETVARVKPSKGTRWEDRIVLGCWAAQFVPLCHKYFPGYPISNIGFSIPYSRQFLPVPNISFNMLHASLISPAGRKFIKECQSRNIPMYTWTVNNETDMDWCIRRGLDGVITDDPKKYLDHCKTFDPSNRAPEWSWPQIANFVRINLFVWLFGILFWRKHGFHLDKKFLADTTTRVP